MTSVLIKGVYYVSKKNRTVKKANQFENTIINYRKEDKREVEQI